LDSTKLALASHTECGNCGSALTGPYCSHCGQHAHESARSISALFHDAWHIATHVDSRFWQTMYILLFKPGKLTKEYFADHRARYLPPVRVYLVLSVLFFGFGLATPNKVRVVSLPSGTTPIAALKKLADDGAAAAPKNEAPPNSAVSTSAAPPKIKQAGDDDSVIVLAPGVDPTAAITSCDKVKTSIPWLEAPLQESCRRNIGNHFETIKHAFVANIPKMMFLFVPMMALVMLLLYWRPKRYYVEHLVFFLHNHAAVFMLLLIQSILSWLAAWLAWRTFKGWVVAFIGIYTVWYVYRAMRAYYGQGRILTLTKLCVVGFTYMIGFSITLLSTLLVSVIIA
jgi:hypothetical protein